MGVGWERIIVHVDMDAFFASVEQLLNPELKGKPVIVGADPKEGRGRGVVAAASYEARHYGVHSAMPISRAYRLCPGGIYLRHHGEAYHTYSQKIFSILSTFSPLVEPLSIDEAFLDLSGSLHLFGSADELGKKIRRDIKTQTGLTASVGIAPVKSVAKIASDFNKPDALTIVPPDEVQKFLDNLPVTRLWGIGKKMCDQLAHMGIHKVYQLRQYPVEVLAQKFGKMGEHIYRMARGEDQRSVIPHEEAKSVSNEVTFESDVEDEETVRHTVFQLSEKVGGRLRRAAIRGRTVHLKIRFQDFKTFTRSHSLKNPTNLTDEIYRIANFMVSEFEPFHSAVRLIGVGVSNLVGEKGLQLTLWDMENERKLQVERIMDQIQDKFGKEIIRHARSLSSGKNFKK